LPLMMPCGLPGKNDPSKPQHFNRLAPDQHTLNAGDDIFGARIFPAEACRSFARPGAGTSIWFAWSPTTTGVENLNAVSMEGRGNSHDAGQLEFTVGPFQIDIRSKTGESQ
jgi:hypothetical protein